MAPRVELMMVLRGRGQHRFHGRAHEYWPGTVFCYGEHERHGAELPEWTEGLEALWVHATPRGMTARLLRCREGPRGQRQRAKRLLAVDRVGIASLNPLMDPGYIAELPAPARPLVVRAGVELLIGRIVTLGYAPPTRAGRPLTWEAMELVADFIGYVGGATDLAECARVAGCTHYHLVRLFPRFHQSRVQEYIDGCRMEETVRLLRNGWLKKDIAARFGMSPSSFSSWQRRRAGLWPWLGEDEL